MTFSTGYRNLSCNSNELDDSSCYAGNDPDAAVAVAPAKVRA